jgi:aminopeptidase N
MRAPNYLPKTDWLKSCLWLFVCLFCAADYGLGQKYDKPQNYIPPEEGVSLALAKRRRGQISDVRYRIRLDLALKAEKIKGSEEIAFVLKIVQPELVLDFRDLDENGKFINGKVSNVAVNGKTVSDFRQINGHLLVAGDRLKIGENKLTLDFESAIATQNRPLVRYQDASDGSEYVYSLLTPMDASLAFVCFDQPDLKGRFTLETKAPENWTVISNAPVAAEKPDAETGYRHTVFQETLPISTYLFAFAAGNFRQIKNENSIVPSSLYVRNSQFERGKTEAPELFRATNDFRFRNMTSCCCPVSLFAGWSMPARLFSAKRRFCLAVSRLRLTVSTARF